jgi:methionine synthase / methylenetetrahydrofolate reductase(NADPH)
MYGIMKKPFRDRLKEGLIICDGAMGTLLDLYEYDELPHDVQNLKNPDIIERIHTEYVHAGAEIIETNTFGANKFRLADFHLQDMVYEINTEGVAIARKVARYFEELDKRIVYVAGAIGPTGKLLAPIGKVSAQQMFDAFKQQIEALVEGGVDLIMLETFVSLNELDIAIDAVKQVTDLPIIAQKAFSEDGAILSGNFPIDVVEHIRKRGVDVVGANCTVGPQRMFGIIKSMYREGVIMSAQPAAGIPTLRDGRSVYHTTPEYLAMYAKQLVEAGVRIIGACCGSTPAHIREIKKAVSNVIPGTMDFEIKEGHPREQLTEEIPAPERSLFAQNIGRKFLTTVELDIPRGLDMSSVIDGARYLYKYGIDAVNITDGARARLRMTPLAICHKIQSETGMETITHLACRDRNMIGMQADLLGCHSLGLKNILVITGDPANIGDYPHATSVFDIESVGFIRAVKRFNEGRDVMGNSIGMKTNFLIGCAANPVADDLEYELEKLERKVEEGAQIVFTQPVLEVHTMETFMKKIDHLNIPVMVGVMPLRSYRHAEFLHNEIPGINIPDAVREKFRSAGENGAVLGVKLAADFLRESKHMVAGAYLLPPFKKYEMAIEILDSL